MQTLPRHAHTLFWKTRSAMLNAAELPAVTAFSSSLINELDQIEKAFVLVPDDYHLIHQKGGSRPGGRTSAFPACPC